MAIEIEVEGKSIVELRNQLKGLRNDLATATDPEQMAGLAEAAGKVKDKMKDINEQVAVFSSGSKFEQISTQLGQISGDLSNLDFEGAAEKAKVLTTMVKGITFSEATKGLSQLGSTFLSLGKALLTNPLFLIPAAITAILGALGLLGPIIDGIKAAFNYLSKAVSEFLDYLGITNTEADKLAKTQKKLREESDKQKEAIAEEGKAYVSLLGQLSATNAGSEDRKTLIKDINAQYGTTLTNMSSEAEFQKQVNAEMDNYIKYLIAKYTLQANEDKIKKNIETQMKIQENYNKSKSEEKRILDEINDAEERRINAGFDQTGRENAKAAQQDIARLTFELQKQKEETGLVNQNLSNARQRFKSYASAAKELSDTIVELTNGGVKYNGAIKTTGNEVKTVVNELAGLSLEIKKIDKIETKPLNLLPDTSNFISWDKLYREAVAQLELESTKSLQGKKDLLIFQMEEEIRMTDATESEKLLIKKKYQDQIDALDDEKRANNIKSIQALEQAGADVIDLFASLKSDSIEKEKTALEEKHTAELAGLEEGSAAYTAAKERQAKENDNVARRAFEANKKSQLGAAIMNAAMGITSIIAQYPKFDGGIAMAAALISTAAINTAAIAKIASTEYKSTGSVGGSNPNTSGLSSTPSYNLFGNNNNANTVNATPMNVNVQNEVKVKAYVSETEITDSQKRIARYQNSATL